MARKAQHDQREFGLIYRCEMCQIGVCSRCLDAMRRSIGKADSLCNCRRDEHDQEVEMGAVVMIEERTSSEDVLPTYRYRAADFTVVWQTSVPKDDEAAIAYFHAVVRFGPDYKPVYCERIDRPEGEGEKYTMLKEVFDPLSMETKPFKVEF